jgi:hypothetical protein
VSPTVLSERGFAVRIYLQPREHGPAHVHVVKDDGEIIIMLGDDPSGIEIREVFGMREAEVRVAFRIVSEHRAELVDAWRRYHGNA